MSQLKVESAFEVLVRARALEKQGRSVIHLEIGEPDFPTPPHIIEAGKRALDEGYTKYGPTAGLPELRESIARYISRTRGISVGPDEVCVVPGAKPIMFFTMLALLERGDEVIYPDPGFPIYESMIRFTGATPDADSAGRKPRLLFRSRVVPQQTFGSHPHGDSEFAAESHRRHHSAR